MCGNHANTNQQGDEQAESETRRLYTDQSNLIFATPQTKLKLKTGVGFIIRKKHLHHRRRHHTGAFDIFLSNSRSISTNVET